MDITTPAPASLTAQGNAECGMWNAELGMGKKDAISCSAFHIPHSAFPFSHPRNITVPQNIVVGTRRKYASPSAFDISFNRISSITAIFARGRMKGSAVA
jgi:hypothetical protein